MALPMFVEPGAGMTASLSACHSKWAKVSRWREMAGDGVAGEGLRPVVILLTAALPTMILLTMGGPAPSRRPTNCGPTYHDPTDYGRGLRPVVACEG